MHKSQSQFHLSPRWMKISRDFWITKGRVGMMVIAIAVGVFAVTTILSAYTTLTREVSGNYLATLPASASLELDEMDDASAASLLAEVRKQPGIAAAEARATLKARIEVKKDVWFLATLFVVQDFNAMQLSRFTPESGAVSPPDGTLLLEREALKLIGAKIGDQIKIKTSDGIEQAMSISGVVHDPSLAPAWQEQTAYSYITPTTLNALSGTSKLTTLKVAIQDEAGRLSFDRDLIDNRVSALATWLEQQGHHVKKIRIPPPGQHPHQGQMTGVLLLLLAFSLTGLVLSAILTATMVSAMLAQQVRQIGVMKAIGGSSWKIANLYLAFILVVGLMATAIGLPAGLVAGLGLSKVGAQLFNINLISTALPMWAYGVALACGIIVPLLVALTPIFKATNITVREAISDFGMQRSGKKSNWISQALHRMSSIDRSFAMALRNPFRRPARLLMTVILLASSGGLFIGTISTKNAWKENLVLAAKDRLYDVETVLNRAAPEASTLALIAAVPGVKTAESWKEQSASKARPDGLLLERTYPDGGHGSLALITVPDQSKLIDLTMLRGRWLQQADLDTVVLNNAAFNYFGKPQVGSTLDVAAGGKTLHLKVVGIAREIMTGSHLYINQASHDQVFGAKAGATSNAYRVAFDQHDANSIEHITAQIESALEKERITTKGSITETMMGAALDGHTQVLIVILLLMAMLMAGVGGLGLASAMATNVVERTREFGIMRTIGGRSAIIMRNLIGEAILIGLLSWVASLVLSIPVAMVLGMINMGMNAGLSLPVLFSTDAALMWLGAITVIAIIASALPARTASRLSIRDTLSFV